MSKKLIAVASASALALSALVGVAPASALPFVTTSPSGNSILVTIGANAATSPQGAGTNGSAYAVNVPSSGLVAAADLVKFEISSDVKTRAFTVGTTSGIKLLDAPGDTTNKYTAASGLASWSSTLDAAGKATFYAYATTTTKGILTVTLDGDITQIYMTGVAGPAYDITSVTLPSLEVEATDAIVATVTDAFGNAVTAGTLDVTRVGTGASGSSVVTYSTTSKRWEGNITAGAVAGQLAVELKIKDLVENTDTKAAFGAANGTYFGVINVSAKGDVKALRAEIATLKADYNKLAARWNKKVASKKAPKKTVATK
jgi:hypothetical protein